MSLLEIFNMYLSVQFKAENALEENFNARCDKKITYEEYEYTRVHWEGVKLGAETLYKKVQELELRNLNNS